MASGVSTRLWEIGDIVALVEAADEKPKKLGFIVGGKSMRLIIIAAFFILLNTSLYADDTFEKNKYDYYVCIMDASSRIDDGVSDATTIAKAAMPYCTTEWRNVEKTIEAQTTAGAYHELPQLTAYKVDLAISVVLSLRSMKRKNSD